MIPVYNKFVTGILFRVIEYKVGAAPDREPTAFVLLILVVLGAVSCCRCLENYEDF